MIVVERTRKRIIRHVPDRFIPRDSFDKKYEGRWVHVLGLDLDGKLWPIERPVAISGRLPGDLYVAKNCADEVDEVYGQSTPLSEKIKLGVLVGLSIAILMVIFLIAAASGGA